MRTGILSITCVLGLSAVTASSYAQGTFPAAAPGDRTAALDAKFSAMETHLMDKVIQQNAPPDETQASRLVSGLKDDFGDSAVNFAYQSGIVEQAALVAMSAGASSAEKVKKILRDGLLDYWDRNQVMSAKPEYYWANAMHFFELGRVLVRTGGAGDTDASNAASSIWQKYAGAHPVQDVNAKVAYLSHAVSGYEYVVFRNQTAAGLGLATIAIPSGMSLTALPVAGPQWNECIRLCKKRLGCQPGFLSQWGCTIICVPECIIDNIINNN